MNVLSVVMSTADMDLALSKEVTAFSFKFRELLYDFMENIRCHPGCSIDIGSGRMQARSLILKPGRSTILCDTNLVIPKSINRRN